MTDCNRCKRTLDASEINYVSIIPKPGDAAITWCADCILKSPPYINKR